MISGVFGADLAEEKKLKVLLWSAGGVSHLMAMIAPPEYGGRYDFEWKTVLDESEANQKNITVEEANEVSVEDKFSKTESAMQSIVITVNETGLQ